MQTESTMRITEQFQSQNFTSTVAVIDSKKLEQTEKCERVQSINQILLMCHRYTQTHRQLMRVYETLNSEITKISMDGGESQGRGSERGSVIKTDRQAFPWHPSRSTRRQTRSDRQAFPWHPPRGTRRQTTKRRTSLPLAPLSEYQETD